ncbi:MAG: DoxX family membrane protein [Deltaproteobacteria bacterium]|nr:DoxX family membrane protein [Deltaproteobacteria bacterium]
MVNPYSIVSFYFNRTKNIFCRGLVYPWPYRIVRIALAALFIYGGVTKLFDSKAFVATISAYDLLPEALLPFFAVGLPLIETIAGLALLLDRPWGLHLITGLLALFVFVLGYGIIGNLDVDCGCFGAEELEKQAGLREAFYRDLILIGVVAPYLYLSRRVREFANSGKE